MFATLAVRLPSSHEGGTLRVTHGGEIKDFFNTHSATRYSSAIFFADVDHELLPTTCGYRVALLYNLVRTDKGLPPAVPNKEAVEEVKRAVAAWVRMGPAADPLKFALKLDRRGRCTLNRFVRISKF